MTDVERVLQLFSKKSDLSLVNEVWLPVVGWEDLYLASNLGRVRSLPRYVTRQGALKNMGVITRLFSGCVLSQNKSGPYNMISLARNGTKITKLVHRIIAEAWLKNPDNKPCINHKDLNKRNNMINNLEWVTYQENECHKHLNNKNINFRLGERSVNTNLLNEEVVMIRWLVKNIDGVIANDLADIFDISYPAINAIIKGRNWKSLLLL